MLIEHYFLLNTVVLRLEAVFSISFLYAKNTALLKRVDDDKILKKLRERGPTCKEDSEQMGKTSFLCCPPIWKRSGRAIALPFLPFLPIPASLASLSSFSFFHAIFSRNFYCLKRIPASTENKDKRTEDTAVFCSTFKFGKKYWSPAVFTAASRKWQYSAQILQYWFSINNRWFYGFTVGLEQHWLKKNSEAKLCYCPTVYQINLDREQS